MFHDASPLELSCGWDTSDQEPKAAKQRPCIIETRQTDPDSSRLSLGDSWPSIWQSLLMSTRLLMRSPATP